MNRRRLAKGCRTGAIVSRGWHRLAVDHQFQWLLGNSAAEIDPAVKAGFIDAGIDGIEVELFAVHGPAAPFRGVDGGADPIEVTRKIGPNLRMDVRGLGRKHRLGHAARDGLRQIQRRRGP